MGMGGQGLLRMTTPQANAGAPSMEGVMVDLETLLSLDAIRTHIKADDVPHVTDEQLRLYRQAAFEACEKYTGRIFSELRVVIEDASADRPRRWRPFYTKRLRYPSADGIIHLYGSHFGQQNRTYREAPGCREIKIEAVQSILGASSCCAGPCASREVNGGMKIMYRTGIADKAMIPAGIIIGILKFIAWTAQNPGDEIMTVRNKENKGQTGIIGTNNGAWASGAIEQWRIFVDDAI